MPPLSPAISSLDDAATCRPARLVAGDYYDFIACGPDRLAIVVADVSGKGMPAALLAANLQARIQATVPTRGRSPWPELRSANWPAPGFGFFFRAALSPLRIPGSVWRPEAQNSEKAVLRDDLW